MNRKRLFVFSLMVSVLLLTGCFKFQPWRSYFAVMSSPEIKLQKYNTGTTKLINLILTLNPEQQRFLLKNVEKFILKEKRTSA